MSVILDEGHVKFAAHRWRVQWLAYTCDARVLEPLRLCKFCGLKLLRGDKCPDFGSKSLAISRSYSLKSTYDQENLCDVCETVYNPKSGAKKNS